MNYTINIADVVETIRQVKNAGYSAMLYINGEYYEIDMTEKKEGKKNV